MSGIVSSISNAIESATYNPEYAKKKEEEQKKIKAAVDLYKKDLEGYRKELDAPIKLPGSGPGPAPRTDYYVKTLSDLLASEKKYVDGEPGSVEEVEQRQQETKDKMEDIRKANQAVVMIGWLGSLPDLVRKDIETKGGKLSKQDLDRFNEVKTKSQTFLKTVLEQKPRDVIEKQKEIEDIWANKVKTNVPIVKSEEEMKKLEKKTQDAEKAEASVFSLRRMIWTIVGSALNTVMILFLVMLFMVGGMLASNAAIGRTYPYRILYFFYGGLFSPFVILYYLYQWLFGTSLKIYTLLPIFTQVSDTSLGRFLFFPFTYTPDQNEETQRMNYLKEAATIVKKSVEDIVASAPPPDAPTIYDKIRAAATGKSQLDTVVQGLEKLQLGSPKQLETVLQGLEGLQLGGPQKLEAIIQQMKKLELPKPSAPPPNID
jgi:hypothetical protein